MSTIKDGGTAFPMQDSQAIHAYAAAKMDAAPKGVNRDAFYNKARAEAVSGMSLRDYYAGKALAGFCANPAVFAGNGMSGWDLVNCTEEQLAECCGRLADAMLKEREAATATPAQEIAPSFPSDLPGKECSPKCAEEDRVYENESGRKNDSGPYTCKKCGFYMPF